MYGDDYIFTLGCKVNKKYNNTIIVTALSYVGKHMVKQLQFFGNRGCSGNV